MNAAAIEALNLVPHSSLSFLNVGAGTGYMSCIVATILGPNSLHIGVELHDDVILHCKESVARWKPTTHVTEKDGRHVFRFEEDDIIIFPSFLKHGTKGISDLNTEDIRITISFNISNNSVCYEKSNKNIINYG
jgi:hypothetical protein